LETIMSMNRRQFLRGVVATGVVAVGASAVAVQSAQGATPTKRLSSTESWLLSTGRRALG
jgi:hypothetical protein